MIHCLLSTWELTRVKLTLHLKISNKLMNKLVQRIAFFIIIWFVGTSNLSELRAQGDASAYFEGTLSFEVEMTGAQADFYKTNEPNTQIDMHIREGDYIVNLMGGKYPKTFMFLADSNREYIVDVSQQAAYRYSPFSDRIFHDSTETPVAKPTQKQATINDVICDIYLVKMPDTYFAYYVNDAYRVDTSLYPPNSNTKASFLIEGLDGRIPLQTIKKQRGITVKTTCTAIKPREFDPDQFKIPSNFKIQARDYRY